MFFLFLAIFSSSAIALIFKYSETSGMNRYAVTSANYFAAVLTSGMILTFKGLLIPEELNLTGALKQISRSISSNNAFISDESSFVWAVVVGLGAGGFFFLAFIYYQISVRNHGVGLSGAFAKLGILVPMILSLLFWKEYPSQIQWLGIALAIFSIVIVNWPQKKSLKNAIRLSLLLLFLFGGISEFSNKVFQKYGLQDHRALFLFMTFSVALAFSLAATINKRFPVKRRDLVTGIFVGIPNLFSSYFLIMALDKMTAAVVFPIYSAGTIVIINLVGLLFFKERLSRLEIWAVILVIISLVLINL
ncbi:MAG TPA: DMT family transporter [candidate division Zixibacteria bacterium]|nr:DMT family transporter [candidate division Zixibacteria bacterium]